MPQLTCRVTAINNDGTAVATSAPATVTAPGGAFTPASLFASGQVGAWYDPSDLSTLWQDDLGTVPVTAAGQAVGRMNDKSGNGKNATQATLAYRPVYQTNGTLHWLDFDGVDDRLGFDGTFIVGTTYSAHGAHSEPAGGDRFLVGGTKGANNENLHIGWANSVFKFGQWNNDIAVTLASKTNAPYISTSILRTSERLLRLNGVQVGTSTDLTPLISWNGASIGLRTGRFMSGNVYSVIIRAGDMSDTVAVDVEAYQAAKSGVTL